MSLKAKIEAVIYAAEEPVTLAQLTGLLGEEGQAELDALDALQQSLALEDAFEDAEADDEDALNSETLVEGDDSVAGEPEPDEEAPAEPGDVAVEPAAEAAVATEEPAAGAGEGPVAAEKASAPEGDALREKQAAREAAAEGKARERRLREYFRSLLDQLMADYANGNRGLEIREVAGGFRLATKPEYHDAVRGFVKSLKPPLKLSLQALETLAVVAYKQPVTAPEISEIRGVDSGGVLGSLMARKLVTTAGRKQVIGRPILYKTTKDFLVRFGLKDINELPSIEEFEKMAGELADTDPVQEEIPMEAPQQNESEEAVGSGHSPAVDEINAAPVPTTIVHANADEILSDKSAQPEGHNREHTDRTEVEPLAPKDHSPEDVEPMADVHEPQADGDSSDVAGGEEGN